MFVKGEDKKVTVCLTTDGRYYYLYYMGRRYENIQKEDIYYFLLNMDYNFIWKYKCTYLLIQVDYLEDINSKILAYITCDNELIIRDIKALGKLLMNPPRNAFMTVQDFAAKHNKSEETVKKYLKQQKLVGARLIKSKNSSKGIWLIPGYTKWPAGEREKGKKDKYKRKKRAWWGEKIENGYVTSLQYSNLKEKSEQQVVNMCKSGRLEAKHIVKNEGNKNGYWIVKKDCPWPSDKRRKEKPSIKED